MHRKLLGGTAIALALAASPALAADMSYPVKAPPIVAVVPVFSWTGFYIGANVGYGWGDTSGFLPYWDIDAFDDQSSLLVSGGRNSDGWVGGLQAGYNYQFYNNVVLGIEADIEFGDQKNGYAFSYTAFDDLEGSEITVTGAYQAKIETFGTVRARLGYAMDRFMPYVTGGLAWANVKVSGQTLVDYFDGDIEDIFVASGSRNETVWGWTVGVGAEYAFTDNWTMKAEYLYSDLGSTNFSGLFNRNDLDFSLQTLKVGVNYKF